jgi:hypothetical protein
MSFIQICEYPDTPFDASTRQSKEAIQLLNTFLLGPSSKSCKIELVDTSSESDSSQKSDQSNSQNKQQQQPQNSASQPPPANQGTASSPSTSDNNSFIRNYSMLEAYSYLHRVFEDEPARNNNQDSSQQTTQQGKTQQATNDSTKKSDSQQQNTDDQEQKLTNDARTTLHVKVSLSKEGYSIWTIVLDSKVTNVDAIKSALKSGNFKAARTLAIKDTNPACFIVSQLKTSVSTDSNFTMNAPFIGRCRYAMDSGSDEDSSEDNTVCIAVAPIDGRIKKPSEKIVFKILYNVLDMSKLTGGSVKSADDKATDNSDKDDSNSRDSDKNQSALSAWINKKFKNDGDSTEYNNFLKLRKFVADQLNTKALEYDSTNSEDIKQYGNLPAVKEAIIAY